MERSVARAVECFKQNALFIMGKNFETTLAKVVEWILMNRLSETMISLWKVIFKTCSLN